MRGSFVWETEFSDRLCKLRTQKKVSARDMSLSLGQSPGYINRIENRKSFPSMQLFFNMCEYLEITPQDFFSTVDADSCENRELPQPLHRLTEAQWDLLSQLIESFFEEKNCASEKTQLHHKE